MWQHSQFLQILIIPPARNAINIMCCVALIYELSGPFRCCLHEKLLQWCLTLCDPMDCGPPGLFVYEILQAGILEWVVMPSSRGSSWPRDQTWVLHLLQWQSGSLPTVPAGKPLLDATRVQILHTSFLPSVCSGVEGGVICQWKIRISILLGMHSASQDVKIFNSVYPVTYTNSLDVLPTFPG